MSGLVPVLRTERLGRKTGNLHIVKEISFELWAGDFLALAGPSGSGKSSLLRLLNRLDEPTEGMVLWGAAITGTSRARAQAPGGRKDRSCFQEQ